ncbi:MAG: 8-amino-7-oxononanoate synthase [Aquificaceae bacterium]|nr:8-amino-7-oxononanoate synthase [Aquificaceae bacterium]MDW8423068.1 8-amino-7-oxononanoate synthase [Aquificaceae bacterium]
MDWLRKELDFLKEQYLYRTRFLREGLKDFCSNDYLGLKKHPEVLEASIRALREYGLGSGASALVSGYTFYHKELEEKLADFKRVECCVLFGSGYLANLGTIQSLVGDGDAAFSDQLNHASIVDACRLSKAKVFVYKHRDYQNLEELLRKNRENYKKCLVVSDTVFSMDGDVADISKLKKLCKEYDCMLYLDEAHATGVLGKYGRGGLEAFEESWEDFLVLMGTLSKAIGSYGAFVCGSKVLCEYLINRARSLIFSTSLPPAVCAGAIKALEIIQAENWRLEKLKTTSERLYEGLKAVNLQVLYNRTPIIPIMVYDESKAISIRDYLLQKGILLQAIRYPTVPKGQARLRLTASLNYSEEDIQLLLEALKSLPPP